MPVIAMRRFILALVVTTALLSTSRRAKADDEQTAVPRDPKPARFHVSPSALMAFGSFAGLPVVRGGVGIEGGIRYVSAHALFTLGQTPNGLGAHRIEIGANLTSPIGWFRASFGPHIGYAMLVRQTERHAFGNALLGDIASFSLGMHATVELSLPISERTRAFIAARAMGEIYRRSGGWELGPTIGFHF